MRSIIVKSGLVALASMVASVALASGWMAAQGQSLGPDGLLISMICPLLIAWPASARNFARKHQLVQANEALARANAALAEAHARLAERADRDRMTGLLNREGFFRRLDAERDAGRAGTLLVVDADRFKSINDTFGHQAGDRALAAFARAIAAAAGPDAAVGRIGGEEFAVFQPSGEDAAGTGERIRAAVEATEFDAAAGRRLRLSVSIGCAALVPGVAPEQAMRLADKRLYAAKRGGRNRVVAAGEEESGRAAA